MICKECKIQIDDENVSGLCLTDESKLWNKKSLSKQREQGEQLN